MLSVKGLFSVASPTSLLSFVPLCLSSASDPCPYLSCPCLPFRASFDPTLFFSNYYLLLFDSSLTTASLVSFDITIKKPAKKLF
jgi:hypothetical protein